MAKWRRRGSPVHATDRDIRRFEAALLAAYPDLTFHLVDWYNGIVEDVPSLLTGRDGVRNWSWVHGWRARPKAPLLRSVPPRPNGFDGYARLPPIHFEWLISRGHATPCQLRQGLVVEALDEHLLNSTYDQSLPEVRSFVDKVYQIAHSCSPAAACGRSGDGSSQYGRPTSSGTMSCINASKAGAGAVYFGTLERTIASQFLRLAGAGVARRTEAEVQRQPGPGPPVSRAGPGFETRSGAAPHPAGVFGPECQFSWLTSSKATLQTSLGATLAISATAAMMRRPISAFFSAERPAFRVTRTKGHDPLSCYERPGGLVAMIAPGVVRRDLSVGEVAGDGSGSRAEG
ncbi:MAG: hypothetical protein U1E53_30990 [Dongiaceae bacterium]